MLVRDNPVCCPSFTPFLTSSLVTVTLSAAIRDSDMISSMMPVISPVDRPVCSERLRISSATTPKLLPYSPACAAMMEAFRASRLVLLVMSLMTLTNPSILPLFALSRLIPS